MTKTPERSSSPKQEPQCYFLELSLSRVFALSIKAACVCCKEVGQTFAQRRGEFPPPPLQASSADPGVGIR